MNTLIAGVGYSNLRDLSVGPVVVPKLRRLEWPNGVDITDLSFGPVAVVQWFQDRPDHYDRAIFIAGVERGRDPGHVYCYRWDGTLPDTEEIQRRVNEAVTGVISLDNLLIITQHFDVLPADVFVVEVEPQDTGWGLGFTERVDTAIEEVIETVRSIVLDRHNGRFS